MPQFLVFLSLQATAAHERNAILCTVIIQGRGDTFTA
jgi:hypothetical protein